MINWLFDRLKERSTWLGIASFLTAAGVALSPEQMEAVTATGLAFAGLIATMTKDRNR